MWKRLPAAPRRGPHRRWGGASAPSKRFAEGKTLPRTEFTSGRGFSNRDPTGAERVCGRSCTRERWATRSSDKGNLLNMTKPRCGSGIFSFPSGFFCFSQPFYSSFEAFFDFAAKDRSFFSRTRPRAASFFPSDGEETNGPGHLLLALRANSP